MIVVLEVIDEVPRLQIDAASPAVVLPGDTTGLKKGIPASLPR